MTPIEMEARIVRYGDLKPCRTAFIDTHTPGSDRKENFSIIGAGVSESADQHVHLREHTGFNIGAAGQPPHCVNSLHSHRTAEVFFVHRRNLSTTLRQRRSEFTEQAGLSQPRPAG